MTQPEDISKEYFNENYVDLVDPAVYGYFQFMFYGIAAESDLSFEDYLTFLIW